MAAVNIKDEDFILIAEIEGKNIIEDEEELNESITERKFFIFLVTHDHQFYFKILITEKLTITELINLLTSKILSKYPEKSKNEFYFLYNGKKLDNSSQQISELGIETGTTFYTFEIKPLFNENLDLDVSVIIDEENKHEINLDFNLNGLLKFCLIKDMSRIIDNDIEYYKPKLNIKMKHIFELISGGNIDLNQTENSIMSVLKKFEGINILNFSRFVDGFITKEELIETFNIFKKEEKIKIQKENDCLSSYNEYMKKFEEDFELARKNSIFEWRITSMTIVDRKDLKNFEEAKKNCPNRLDKILFHGTGIVPSSKILTDMFLRSEKSGYQHGKGVYFTDFLDYAWYYGGISKRGNINANRANLNIIPKIEDSFVMVGSYIYYDKKGFKRVYDYKYNPGKNEINFAYAGSNTETIRSQEPDKSKFYGTEYVIYDLNQICPFLGCSLKRDEFCVIWRDTNFSPNPVYHDKFDKIFKDFLKKRMEYIQEQIKFNVYPCETSEEALELIKRKKYNKIILISNAGNDLGGKKFITEARKILGYDVIVLFLCYNIEHLKWICKFKNALFSNEPQFYENYIQSFVTSSDIDEEAKEKQIKDQLVRLIIQMQQKYKVHFTFDQDFLKYPYFKKEGHFSDLTF